MITKSLRGHRSRSQQAPVNQTKKSKSPGRVERERPGFLLLAEGVVRCGLYVQGGYIPHLPLLSLRSPSPVHDAVTVESHEVNLAATSRAN